MRTTAYAILTTLALAACGGSGSTGLITAEAPLLAEVRETGECRDANGTTYCFADVLPEFQGQPPMIPEPIQPVEFDTRGIDAGTACAVATRHADGAWDVGAISLTGDDARFSIEPASDLGGDGVEAALLCFDPPPSELPAETETLAELGPTIIYVAPVL